MDRSVLLSACGSDRSLSRLVDELAPDRGWLLISAFNCHAETAKNIMKLGAQVALRWPEMQPQIEWVPKALTSKTPLLLVERR